VLKTSGYSTCLNSDELVVNQMDVEYDRTTKQVSFDIGGTSKEEQNVTMVLTVTAYGKQVYSKTYDPCTQGITVLCPVPKGTFHAASNLTVPDSAASQIPAIAFQIPDLDGVAKIELKTQDGTELACLESTVENGETADQPSVKYVTAAIAAAALAVSGISAAGAAGGGAGPSPNFGDVMMWFQSVTMNGMMTVNYPKVYRSFSTNFAWSTGLIPFKQMQESIDNFRKATGGKLTQMSYEFLANNATLIYSGTDTNITGSNSTSSNTRRALDWVVSELLQRDVSVNGTSVDTSASNSTSTNSTGQSTVMRYVHGVQAEVETLKIPSANTFMTVLEIFCIAIAAVAVCILLFKVILEVWALFATFPKGLTGFRKRYWSFLATTIVRIVLILYGTWVLYCLYQFTHGDSWGAHLLAGVTLAIFTAILAFFAWRIITVARAAKREPEGAEKLFQDKPTMRRYGLFYEQFKSNFWWLFVPLIVYAFAKGAFLAIGDGHGLVQTIGQLGCEIFLLVLLVWNRPYNTRSGNVINIIISVVRVLSIVCLIVFVDELGIAAETKTITGVALIVVQSTLTAALAILIVVNAIITMCKENPHRKRRKELEKAREADLTPLDARNSLLSGGYANDGKGAYVPAATHDGFYSNENANYPLHHMTPAPEHQMAHYRAESATSMHNLVSSAAPHARIHSGSYEDYRGQYPPNEPVGVAHGY
jgi:hypothetical protein